MTSPAAQSPLRWPAIALAGTTIGWLDRIPYALLALPLRLAVATVFWNSAQAHLANWQTTLYQFATDYALPFLPPVPAAYLAVAIEVTTPILLVFGLLTRAAEAWPTHIQWAAMLFVLLARGPGKISVDWLLCRSFLGEC
jgi:putative oxidoreductase